MTTPTRTTVAAWFARWQAIRKDAYQQLLASYTPEQRELVRRMNKAGSEANYIRQWLHRPERCKRLPVEPPQP